ncbi:MAG: arginine--tRNA ligase [Candidatus Omnitrophota bacterium]
MINTQNDLQALIRSCLKELGEFTAEPVIYLDIPQDSRFGDLTTNVAMQLSRQLKKSPREIAAALISCIQKHLPASPLKDHIKEIKVEGAGFINFYFNDGYFYRELKEIIAKGSSAFKLDFGKGKKVLIEFVSANPTGPLSVAHARQAAVGDALANVFNFLGYKTKKEYYLNDEGNQINILGRSVGLRIKELRGEKIEFPEDHYQGDYIYDIAREAIAKNIEADKLSDYAANYILEIIKKELDDFGVKFDTWFSQKALGKSGKVEAALENLKKRGFIYEEEGAVWFKSTAFGDDKDRVVIKSDKSYTYLTPDIAYHQEKYLRGFEQLINLWGPDHHGYINRLKASVAAFGKDPGSLSIIIVQLATIFRDGKPVHMSTRRGQYITLREVLDEVGCDAARYFFIMRRTSSHLDFDLDVAKNQSSENPVYYVQYAYARISSILREAKENAAKTEPDLSLLKEKEEKELIRKLCQFPCMLNICLSTEDPYMVTVYLQALAEAFHKFYDLHRVLGEDKQLTAARLALLSATRIVIATGLELLGVSRPEKM